MVSEWTWQMLSVRCVWETQASYTGALCATKYRCVTKGPVETPAVKVISQISPSKWNLFCWKIKINKTKRKVNWFLREVSFQREPEHRPEMPTPNTHTHTFPTQLTVNNPLYLHSFAFLQKTFSNLPSAQIKWSPPVMYSYSSKCLLSVAFTHL